VSTPEPQGPAATLSAVTQGEYPYPPDEFDAVDPSDGPRGVHRRPRSRWATLWPYLLVLAVSAAVTYVVVGFLWDERQVVPTAQASEPAVVTDAATEAPAVTPAPAPTPTPAPTPEPTVAPPVPTPTPSPDLSTPVLVLNATSVVGLAADAAGQLEDAGWSDVGTGNFAGGSLPASTVRYAGAELEASARAVADALGITTVELAESDATDGIEVVLESDFAG
jgi:LytR cell envelope-related transcriptional attenuator